MKIEAAKEFGDNEELFIEIADELGTFYALELRLLRVRDFVIDFLKSFQPEKSSFVDSSCYFHQWGWGRSNWRGGYK